MSDYRFMCVMFVILTLGMTAIGAYLVVHDWPWVGVLVILAGGCISFSDKPTK